MNAWQPIDTASKDGPPLLLWDPYYLMRIGRWLRRAEAEAFGKADMLEPGEDGCWAQDLPYGSDPGRGEVEKRLEPTHWMQLPLPPTAGTDSMT